MRDILGAEYFDAGDDARWDAAFEASPDLLERLAAKAREDYGAGRVEVLDPGALCR